MKEITHREKLKQLRTSWSILKTKEKPTEKKEIAAGACGEMTVVGDVSSRDGSKGIALSFPLCVFL